MRTAASASDDVARVSRQVDEIAGSEFSNAPLRMKEQAFSPPKPIGWTGKIGEMVLNAIGGTSQKYFWTKHGGRYVDQLVKGVAHEARVGYISLRKSVAKQILKDAELLKTGQVRHVVWHFFTSPVTGKVGPSGPLRKALREAGIEFRVYNIP